MVCATFVLNGEILRLVDKVDGRTEATSENRVSISWKKKFVVCFTVDITSINPIPLVHTRVKTI